MARVYLDELDQTIKVKLLGVQRDLAKTKDKLIQAERDLPAKQAELKLCEKQLKPIRDVRCEFGDMPEAKERAKRTMAEMDQRLNTLDIELVGLREEVKAIERYRQPRQSLREQARARLDEMFVELMVEQSGLEARRDKTALIRAKEERFLRLEAEHTGFARSISELRSSSTKLEGRILSITKALSEPDPSMRSPKVLDNTAILYHLDDPSEPAEP